MPMITALEALVRRALRACAMPLLAARRSSPRPVSVTPRWLPAFVGGVLLSVLAACSGGVSGGASTSGSNNGGNAGSSPATTATGYSARSGKIYDARGQEIRIRGINHFGFNATILQPQFLWAMGWKEQIAQVKSLGFNAIRVPFVPDTLYNTTPVDVLSYVDPNLNPELIGKTPLQALDLWMAEADRQGMYILLDFHSVSMQRQYPTWFLSDPADFNLIYNKQAYTKEHWTRDLAFVARRYTSLTHFFGIDIYNEPNGIVRWSTGDANTSNPIYFWKAAAELASAAILAANPNLLIFVQGINGNFDGVESSSVPMNWGEDFQPEAYQPLNIPNDKLVLTPHTYGPDVFMKSSFSASDFPANLAANWDILFGQFFQTHTVVVGEWGGKYGQGTGGHQDVIWQNAFVDYLLSKDVRHSFYWAYTPNSGDTGGILDDSLNVRPDKMALLQKLWGASTPVPAPNSAPGVQLQSCAGIMPLGDSITLGVNGGYRNNLYTGLQQNSCGVDNVGTQSDPNTRVADKDHEGHPGFTIGDIAGSVNAWMASTQPNVILLMIGTNDTAWWTNEDGNEIAVRHNALIDQLRTARPDAWFLVASIPPQSSVLIHGKADGTTTATTVDRAVLTQQFNAAIRSNVNARVAAGQHVRFVDVNSVLTTADLYDGIHPTETAHAKVAQIFLDGIRAVLASTSAPPA
jgi:aryl-phospho-beta-D-glucosidase BglC (GH1 family)/lysophospholipase L1-like esterase